MKQLFFAFLSVFAVLSVFSCGEKSTADLAEERVDSFAVHYFNWQYPQCVKHVTPESKKYLEMLATNVTEDNVNMLRSAEENAYIEIEDIVFEGDSKATAKLTIHNYLAADTIGRKAKFHEEGTAELKLVKTGTKWFVDMSKGCIRTAYRQQNVLPDRDEDLD